MSLKSELRKVSAAQLQAAIQDLNSEMNHPEKSVTESLRRAKEYPAFGEVVSIMQHIGQDKGIDSIAFERLRAMMIIFEALIAIAEADGNNG